MLSPSVLGGVRAAGLGAVTLGALGVEQVHEGLSPEDERHQVFQWHMRRWARALMHVFGVETLVQGEVARPTGARLVVANHRSPLDITALLGLFGGCVLSRADLADWPVLGVAARKAGTIFVDRSDGASGARAIRNIRARLKDGHTVIVFPEGGSFAGDEVRPLKGGAFAAIRGLDVEIVPVGIAYNPGVEFVNETFGRRLSSFDIMENGDLTNRVTVAEFGHGVFPDGLTFDVDGGIWITSIVSNRVIRVAPDGSSQSVEIEDSDPDHVLAVEDAFQADVMTKEHLATISSQRMKNISSLAFGGSRLDRIHLGCLLDDRIYICHSPVQGHPPSHWHFEGPRLL